MIDYLLIGAVAWILVGLPVAAYVTHHQFGNTRSFPVVQFLWPIYLVQIPFWIRERNRVNQERAEKFKQK